MKEVEIEIGGTYLAKVSGNLVPVRVLNTREISAPTRGNHWPTRTVWDCRNERTGRTITVRSCQRFRQRLATT